MTPQQRMDTFRALRDSALAVLQADLAMVRGDVAQRSPTDRVIDRAREATFDVLDEALDFASDHRGAVISGVTFATIAGALWLARDTVFEWLADMMADDNFGDNDHEEEREDHAEYAPDRYAGSGHPGEREPAYAGRRSPRDRYSVGEF